MVHNAVVFTIGNIAIALPFCLEIWAHRYSSSHLGPARPYLTYLPNSLPSQKYKYKC